MMSKKMRVAYTDSMKRLKDWKADFDWRQLESIV
jgi:hypothetical protein